MEKLTAESKFIIFFDKKGNSWKQKRRDYCSFGYSEYSLHDVKEYFENENNHFDAKEIDLKKYHSMVGEGFVFLPINESTTARDVDSYVKLGFKCAYMRSGVFRQVKKLYKEWI